MGTGKISMNFFHTFCDPLNYFSDSIKEEELVSGMSPLHICVKTMVSSPAPVFVSNPLFRYLRALSIFPNNTFSPFLHACMYENIQTVGFIPEKDLLPPAE